MSFMQCPARQAFRSGRSTDQTPFPPDREFACLLNVSANETANNCLSDQCHVVKRNKVAGCFDNHYTFMLGGSSKLLLG